MSTLAVPGATSRPLKPEIEQFFREYSEMLYCTAYSMLGNRADAEDVLQTLFLRLIDRGLPPDIAKNPGGYFYRAAVNLSLNVIRSRKRHKLAGDVEKLNVPAPDSSSFEESHQRLTEAIAELNPDDAHVLILRYIHNQSDAAIAKTLGVSRGSIAMRLFRSRLRLRKLMGEQK
jgi:RNA polymerase sigma-70 factor (ECF subfamily)